MRLLDNHETNSVSGAVIFTSLSPFGFNEYFIALDGPWENFFYVGAGNKGAFFFDFDGTIEGPNGYLSSALFETSIDEEFGCRNFFIATSLID